MIDVTLLHQQVSMPTYTCIIHKLYIYLYVYIYIYVHTYIYITYICTFARTDAYIPPYLSAYLPSCNMASFQLPSKSKGGAAHSNCVCSLGLFAQYALHLLNRALQHALKLHVHRWKVAWLCSHRGSQDGCLKPEA